MSHTKDTIGLIPQGLYIVVTIPASVYHTSIEHLNEATKKAFIETKTREYVESGAELIVAAVGKDCNFLQPDDKILVASHARLQKIELDGDENTYFALREGDAIGKLSK